MNHKGLALVAPAEKKGKMMRGTGVQGDGVQG
jgi:hypothetical protein